MAKLLHNICSVTSRHRTSCRHWHHYNAMVTSLRCSCSQNHSFCVVCLVRFAMNCCSSLAVRLNYTQAVDSKAKAFVAQHRLAIQTLLLYITLCWLTLWLFGTTCDIVSASCVWTFRMLLFFFFLLLVHFHCCNVVARPSGATYNVMQRLRAITCQQCESHQLLTHCISQHDYNISERFVVCTSVVPKNVVVHEYN